MNTNIYWILASMVFILALFFDCAHAFYYYEESARIPFFVSSVFGNDWIVKLEIGALFALFIAGCEVSE